MKKERAKSDWKCAYCGTPSIITLAGQVEDLTAEVAMAQVAMRGAMQLATEVEAERDALKERVRVLEELLKAYRTQTGLVIADVTFHSRAEHHNALGGGKETT